VKARKGKCPHCGARLDWSAATRSRSSRVGLVVIALVVAGAAGAVTWTTWGGADATAKKPAEIGARPPAASCEALTNKLVSGAALSRSEIETFRSQCTKLAPSR
jgi:hypothetical protein